MLLVLSTAALAQPGTPDKRGPPGRRIVVRADEAATLHLLRVAPGVVTTVVFNDDIVPSSVDTKALAPLFAQVKVYPGVMVLRPSVSLPESARPLVTARFVGEDAPRQVAFMLVTDPKEVDTVVEVSRHALSAEALAEELTLLRGRSAAAEAGFATLRAQCAQTGLGGAVLTGALVPHPMSVKWLFTGLVDPGLEVVGSPVVYSQLSARVVAFTLKNAPDMPPWMPGMARLARVGQGGAPGRVILEAPVRMLEARLAPGTSVQAVVEWNMPEGSEPGSRYVLEVQNEQGDRTVRWEGLSL
ncbi:DUF2381 family protein [Corallococcus terminator]|uniref:DUF2381 family protein n=1 Tax=Corallococcus terminator TaxID=2316733 RepID=A0A3A8J6X7_9BACT|nr:DUF2381 family protein [Corallococcus terminator]RKG86261.1 DUF2381 family protein [Corallococcus terminator]